MARYIHWLKINGKVFDEKRQYKEIQNYLDCHNDSTATIYLYEFDLFDRAVKLECNQSWNDLDLDANTCSHRLRRLSQKPRNIFNPNPFAIPDHLS